MSAKFLTKQQILDTVYTKLRAQGCRSVSDGFSCAYKSGDLKCAIGHLIPDDLYCSEIEEQSPISQCKDNYQLMQTLLESGIDVADEATIKLLSKLQSFHDCVLARDGGHRTGWTEARFDVLWYEHVFS